MILRRNADAGVLHRDAHLAPLLVAAHDHLDVPERSELDGVGEQVEDDLLHLLPIGPGRLEPGLQVREHLQPRLLDQRLDLGEKLSDQGGHLDLLEVERHLSCLDAADVEDVVDDGEQVAGVGVHPQHLVLLRGRHVARDTLKQHAGVTEDGIEGRAELVRHVGEELALELGGLLQLEMLPLQQLVAPHQLAGGLADLLFQLLAGGLDLLVQAGLLQRLGAIVEDGDHGRDLPVLAEHLARHRFHRQRLQRGGIDEGDLAAPTQPLAGEEQVGDEGGEVGVVAAHGALRLRGLVRFRGREQALGGRVHQQDLSRRIGDEDGVGDRIDDQVQPVALGAHVRFRHLQTPVVLLDLLGGGAQVRDVPQDGDHAGPLARVLHHRRKQLEEEVGSLGG